MQQRKIPEFPVQPGWEISLGETGAKGHFLAAVIEQVPDGSILDVEDVIDFDRLGSLSELFAYERRKRGFFRSAHFGLVIDAESREELRQAVFGQIDLRKNWCHIHVFKDAQLYLQSHDFMYDSSPFLTDHFSEDLLQTWQCGGVIREFARFEPA